MKYSDPESFAGLSDDVEALVERALPVLPELAKLLYATTVRREQETGLSKTQQRALAHLASRHRQTVGEIAVGLGVSMPSASEVVDRLVEAGHVDRCVNPADRRQVFITPTASGKRLGAAIQEARRQPLRAALRRLPPNERPVLVRSLLALAAALRDDLDAGGTPLCPLGAGEASAVPAEGSLRRHRADAASKAGSSREG